MTGKIARPSIEEGLFFLGSALLAAVFLWFGPLGWPGLHWDGSMYGTPVINVAQGKGWIFGSHTPFLASKDSLDYNVHGLLHVALYGSLLQSKDWSIYIDRMATINALTFAVYTAIYAILLAPKARQRWKVYGSALLLGVVPGVIGIGLQGRPEQILPLILALPLMAHVCRVKPSTDLLISALTLALVLLTSPLPGAFFLIVISAKYFLLSQGGWRVWLMRLLAVYGLTIVIAALLVSLLTPFTLLGWVSTVLGRGPEALDLKGLLQGPADWGGWTLMAPGWSLASIFFILSGLVAVGRTGKLGWLVSLAALACWLFLNGKMADYSYVPFLPYAVALGLLAPHQLLLPKGPLAARNIYRKGIVIQGFLYLIVLAWFLVASMFLPPNELALKTAQKTFLATQAGAELQNESIAIGYPFLRWPSFVVFGDAGDRYISVTINSSPTRDPEITEYEAKTSRPLTYVVFPQTKAARNPCPPPESIFVGRIKFALLENKWSCPNPTILDRIAGPTPLSNRYNFAIYKRSSEP